MDYIIYYLLDCLDTFAVFFLCFSIFHYPIREYLREMAFIAAVIAAASLTIREVFEYPAVDPIVHLILMIGLLRYVVKVKIWRATLITVVGVVSFILIQQLFTLAFVSAGISDVHRLAESHSWDIRIIQIASDMFDYLLAYTIVRFGWGITVFVRPPHNTYAHDNWTKQKLIAVTASALSIITICIVFQLYLHRKIFVVTGFIIALLLALLYVVYRRDTHVHRKVTVDRRGEAD